MHPQDLTWTLCVLADGQGGRPGGARAAQLACEWGMRLGFAQPPALLAVASTWASLIEEADREVAGDAEAGFTTLVAFGISSTHLLGASVGDSALWLHDTESDRVVDVTARQLKNPPVGSEAVSVVPFSLALPTQWTALAMSDGLWKYGGYEKIPKAVRESRGEELLDRLRGSVRTQSGSYIDDCTAVVLHGHQGSGSP